MCRDVYDIAIIGLGPAGSTLARLLPRDLKVIAIDMKDTENNAESHDKAFRKPCGGMLAPDAQKILSRFELFLPKSLLAEPQIFSVRTIDVKSNITRSYQRFYINMDRHKFDLWLISLIPDTVEVWDNTRCIGLVREGGLWRIDCTRDGERRSIGAKYIVGADGANSIVRRTVFPNRRIRSYLSIQQGFAADGIAPSNKLGYMSVFDPDTTDCYAWGLSKDDVFIFGGAFPKKDAKARFGRLKEKMRSFGYRLDNPLYTEACLVLRPSSPRQFCDVCESQNAFFIGEAAGFVSPSSLEGISYAMNSALLLSKAFRADRPARAYKKYAFAIKQRLTLKLLKCPFLFSPPLRKIIMKSGLNSINIYK